MNDGTISGSNVKRLLDLDNLLTEKVTTFNHGIPAVIPSDIRLNDDFIADEKPDFVCYRRLN